MSNILSPGEMERLGNRDGWCCHLCMEPVDSTLAWPDPMAATPDHLLPRSDGGPTTIGNLALAHHACNNWRGNAELLSAREARVGWKPMATNGASR